MSIEGNNSVQIDEKEFSVSVIIPLYNSEDTIITVLDSVKKQTAIYLIKEIIVVNDGSTDNSLDLVKQYKNNNQDLPILIIDKTNGGVSSARNAGMKVANGNYIALLDSDDKWLPEKIEKQMRIMSNDRKMYFLGSRTSDKPFKILIREINTLYKASIKDICLRNFPQTSSVIFKKEVISKLGYFDETQRYGEDINYFQKICVNYNYYVLPEKLVENDFFKPFFAYNGLTSNLKGMHAGTIKNIKELKNENIISDSFYMFLRCFYEFKYVLRVVIRKIRLLRKR